MELMTGRGKVEKRQQQQKDIFKINLKNNKYRITPCDAYCEDKFLWKGKWEDLTSFSWPVEGLSEEGTFMLCLEGGSSHTEFSAKSRDRAFQVEEKSLPVSMY